MSFIANSGLVIVVSGFFLLVAAGHDVEHHALVAKMSRLLKEGLAQTHPAVIEIRRELESQGVGEDAIAELLRAELSDVKIEQNSKVEEVPPHFSDIHGKVIAVAGLLVTPSPLADKRAEQVLLDKIYGLLANPQLRSKLICIYPAGRGVIFAMHPTNLGEFALSIHNLQGVYAVQSGDLGELYRIHCAGPENQK